MFYDEIQDFRNPSILELEIISNMDSLRNVVDNNNQTGFNDNILFYNSAIGD